MSRWFRFYDDALNDPKVQLLPGEVFKAWVNMLCLASKNDGVLPSLGEIAFALRIDEDKVSDLLNTFYSKGLLDEVEQSDGPMGYAPHNWNARQYKSDVTDPTAAQRQKAYRNRNADRNATVTVTATRAETEQKQKDIPTVAKATRRDEQFEEFWKVYPRRDGANPKEPAAKLFASAVKAGETPENIIAGAKRCGVVESKNIGTPYIPQAVKWLRDKRWRDYQQPEAEQDSVEINWDAQCLRFKQGMQWSAKWYGPEPGALGCRVPPDILAKHGLLQAENHDPPPVQLRSMQ